jgi:hypothetical protein
MGLTMKPRIAALLLALSLSAGPSAMAGSVEKTPLGLNEITRLAVEEELDKEALADTEAGLKSGAGLMILLLIGVAILVAT